MFDQLIRQVVTWGWHKVASSPSTQAAVKQYALQAGATVAAMGMRKAADMAEDKIEELEERGSLSPKAAAVASGAVRVANVGSSVAVAAVCSASGSAIDEAVKCQESVRMVDAVRGAARNPAATSRTYLENTATGLSEGKLGAHLAVQGHAANAKYLMGDEDE